MGADTLGGGACDSNADGAISFDATVTADQLPLTLCGGRVWYLPPPDAYSRPADAAVGSFEYYVRDGTQRSPPATVSVVATPIDDPPTATPFTIEAYDGVPPPSPFTLMTSTPPSPPRWSRGCRRAALSTSAITVGVRRRRRPARP